MNSFLSSKRLLLVISAVIISVSLFSIVLLGVLPDMNSEIGDLRRETSRGVKIRPSVKDKTVCIQSSGNMCLEIYTGTQTVNYRISNPGGVLGFRDYQLTNFEQRLLQSGADFIDIEVQANYYIDTQSPYPIIIAQLPQDIREAYLSPESGWIQSDAPEIATQANALVSGATRQAEATEAVLAWIRAHVEYDASAPGNDALSVFRSRQAICTGFSTLSVALLRAAGIPSRIQHGCATSLGYMTGAEGGWHAWIEVYYPDVGWVASEPQNFANTIDPYVIFLGFDQCSQAGTEIVKWDRQGIRVSTDNLQTPYTGTIRSSYNTATVLPWERHSLEIIPASVGIMLPTTVTTRQFTIWVENTSCGEESWQIRTTAAWLYPHLATSDTAGTTTFTIESDQLATGSYSEPLIVYGTADSWGLESAISRTVRVNLWVVDEIFHIHLPIVTRHR